MKKVRTNPAFEVIVKQIKLETSEEKRKSVKKGEPIFKLFTFMA